MIISAVLAATSFGCRTDEAPASVAPASDVDASAEPSSEASREPEHMQPSGGDNFVVTLASQCRYTWKGILVTGEEHEDEARPSGDGWQPGGFEIRQASNRELLMRRGDSLLLTNPSGGIMALTFDKLTRGYGARVEITPECSGVSQTLVRAGSR